MRRPVDSAALSDDSGPGASGAGAEPRAALAAFEAELVAYKLKYESSVSWLKELASSNQPTAEAAREAKLMKKELLRLERSLTSMRRQLDSASGPL